MVNEESYLGVSPIRLMMLNAEDDASQLLQGMIDGSDTETNTDNDSDYDYDSDVWGMVGGSDEEEMVNVNFDEARGVRFADGREARAAMVSNAPMVNEASGGVAMATVAPVAVRLRANVTFDEAMGCQVARC